MEVALPLVSWCAVRILFLFEGCSLVSPGKKWGRCSCASLPGTSRRRSSGCSLTGANWRCCRDGALQVQLNDIAGRLGRSPETAEIPIALLARVAQNVEPPCSTRTRWWNALQWYQRFLKYNCIAQSGALPGKAQDCAIGAFIGLHGQKLTYKKLGFGNFVCKARVELKTSGLWTYKGY
jgi:hypothetical protein